MIKVGSLFAGIGGFEKGIEDAFDGMAETVWQVEQNSFCQKVLKKHWPNATIFDDVRTVGKHNLEPVHILCGGFPCQSISLVGKMEGLENEEKSGLWWEMHRIISELRDTTRVILLENVANVLSVGGPDVIGSLAEIGYDCEWTVIRASDFGAPHHRARWFCVAYPSSIGHQKVKNQSMRPNNNEKRIRIQHTGRSISTNVSNTNSENPRKLPKLSERVEEMERTQAGDFVRNSSVSVNGNHTRTSNWPRCKVEPILLGMDDGVSDWMDRTTKRDNNQRIKALGNAIVPQCSEWVARQVLNSGLLDDLLEDDK